MVVQVGSRLEERVSELKVGGSRELGGIRERERKRVKNGRNSNLCCG